MCSALLNERGSKAEFGYDSRKGFTPCDRDPLGREDARGDLRETSDEDGWSGVTEAKDGERGPCVPPCFKKVNLKPSLAKTHAEVSRRVIVTLALGVQVAKKLL